MLTHFLVWMFWGMGQKNEIIPFFLITILG